MPTEFRGLFDAARSAVSDGMPHQAIGILQRLLEGAPGEPQAQHLLAIALLQCREAARAREAAQRAVDAFPEAAPFHNTVGEAHRACGALLEARAAYERAVELDRDLLPAWNNLGFACHALGDMSGSVRAFRVGVKREPDSAEAHNNLAIALKNAGKADAALAGFRRACDLAPGNPEAWNNVGVGLHERGQLEEAEQALGKALALAPEHPRVHLNLSRVLHHAGREQEAERSVREALRLDPRYGEAHAHLILLLRAQGLEDEAVRALHEALEMAPDHPVLNNDAGVLHLIQGRFEEAESHLRRALEADPCMAVAYENLARTRRFEADAQPLLQRIEQLLAAGGSNAPDRVHLHFAAGKLAEDLGEFERAFTHIDAANVEKRSAMVYDAARHAERVGAIIDTVDAKTLARLTGARSEHAAPIFIIGMPRSGTTLVEQILASHSQVTGAGEQDYFQRLSEVMAGRLGVPEMGYPCCLARLETGELAGIAAAYLAEVRSGIPQLAADGGRFTDKMPTNFEHLGLIASVFPSARFVHCVRDARDTCLSVYMTHFNAEAPFAYDLREIGAFYNDYLRLMRHWKGLLGERIINVDYARLVAEQEPVTRELLDFLDLPFESECLDFHRTQRQVSTASHWQVRQPLYADAQGRWQRYAGRLDPLLQVLGE